MPSHATAMTDVEDWWFKTSLPRRYAFEESRPYINTPYGEYLWDFVWNLTETQADLPVQDQEIKDIVRRRTTAYIVSRLVIEARRIRRGFSDEPLSDAVEKYLTDLLDKMIDRVLNIAEADRNRISDCLLNITRRLSLEHGRPTSGQLNVIAGFAEANSHRCYLCAAPLNYRDFDKDSVKHLSPEEQVSANYEHNRRNYELEHIYPVSKGGTRSSFNLAACCHECNEFKENMTTFAELQIETIMIASDEPGRVLKVFGARQRFGLFWRQQGRCVSCTQPFFEKHDERLFVVRREKDDAYHFLNTQIICGECHDTGDYEGIQFRGN